MVIPYRIQTRYGMSNKGIVPDVILLLERVIIVKCWLVLAKFGNMEW